MTSKKIYTKAMECFFQNIDNPEARGFQVTGYKNSSIKNLVSFIISGISTIILVDATNQGLRTRIKWLADGFEVREEVRSLQNVLGSTKINNIFLVDRNDLSTVILQGDFPLINNSFEGQLINVEWDRNQLKITPIHDKACFLCAINSDNRIITCTVSPDIQ